MRVLYFFAYVGLGVAFIAVSAWLFLSKGKSAKAVRTKYKLGGLMLSAWAIVSAASCNGPGPTVTCYEPVAPPEVLCYDVAMETDVLVLPSSDLQRGKAFDFVIQHPAYSSYILQLKTSDLQKVLQEERFTVPADHAAEVRFAFTPVAGLPAGDAVIQLSGIYRQEGSEVELLQQIVSRSVTLK
ncbi:MAG: hypothetical protein IKH11_08175 [Bacteroidales bacterium]|nr:hypothetical protein [Bacteroidales bacterium]